LPPVPYPPTYPKKQNANLVDIRRYSRDANMKNYKTLEGKIY